MSISKTQYIRGLQCHKSLWLDTHAPELRDATDGQTESLVNTGNILGEYVKRLFPGGVEIEFNPDDFNGMIEKTQEAIRQRHDTIYEASFKQQGIFARADILKKNGRTWDICEVKASTGVEPYQLDDAAIQYYAINNAVHVGRVYIVHINSAYVRKKRLSPKGLFTIVDITDDVLGRQAAIASDLKKLNRVLKGDQPVMDIGPHCSDPFSCDFGVNCWGHIPESSVFDLYRMKWEKRFELYRQGIISLEDIPEDTNLNDTQSIQVESSVNNKVFIDKEALAAFLKTIKYPISFLDFETFKDAIPRFEEQRPYMHMPFQYSLHVVNKRGGLKHYEYLAQEGIDPRREFAERMLNDLPKSGSIVVFNEVFEKSRIKELAALFPDLASNLIGLLERFVDLLDPFPKRMYYHPDFNGSFSIKSVLPALFPNDPGLDYKSLEIQDGGMAMNVFGSLHLIDDEDVVNKIRQDLLAYCHLDTLAMVKIWEKLRSSAAS